MFYLIKPLEKTAKKKVSLLVISMCFGLFFYAVSLQVSSSLLLYINADVNTAVFGFTIPPEYFMSIYPLFILMSAPFLAKIWSTQAKTNAHTLIQRVNLSLYLAALSFLLIAISTLFTKDAINWQLILILVGLFVLGLGELAIGPIVTSAVTYLSPAHRHGIFMGLWYLLIGYSAYISSLMAKMISLPSNPSIHHGIYFQSFLWVAGITLVIAASMTLLKRPLNKLCPDY